MNRTPPVVENVPYMIRAASTFVPAMEQAKSLGSLFTTKTVLPASEMNDSRPILCRPTPECPRLINILGGKIDNIYDIRQHLDELLSQEQNNAN